MKVEAEEIKYLNGNVQDGIKVDWQKVFSYYKALKMPKGIYNPAKELDPGAAEWFILISSRSTGKTTNLLIISIILFLMYGITTPYIRQRPDMTARQNIEKLFEVIRACGYIKDLTDGQYNNVYYFGHKMYLCHIDEKGERDGRSEAFLYALDLTQNEVYKSSLNMPTGDFIIFDEFISSTYANNEFVILCDLLKTILRDRLTGKIFLLANTTNYYNEYLRELYIQDEVLKVGEDEPFIKLTQKKTRIFVHIISNRNKQRAKVNTLYFGFDNPKLASITGGSWAVDSYPHFFRDDERELVAKDFYITYAGKILQLDLYISPKLGKHVFVHDAIKINDKARRIYTIGEIDDRRQAYKFGDTKIDKILWRLYNANKWYYYNNDIGFTVDTYVNKANKL